jgi:hypothetical protein
MFVYKLLWISSTANSDAVIPWTILDGKLRCTDEEVFAGLDKGSVFAEFFTRVPQGRRPRGPNPHNTPVIAVLTRDGNGWSVELNLSNFTFPDGQDVSIVGSKATKRLDFEGDVEEVVFFVTG